ncbi:unnamed protein product, partial [Phaeothamnion confervicola]
ASTAPRSARARQASQTNTRSMFPFRRRLTARPVASKDTCTRMAATVDPMLKPLTADDYMAIGLACCYVMNEENKLDEYYVYEPLTAGTLETIDKGIETSYRRVMALRCADYFTGDVADPTGVNMDAIKALDGGEGGHLCEDAIMRSQAAARTFRRRVEAQVIPVGEVVDDFNFNTERKRILNHKYEPSFDDNVKQDKSIDVYGREPEEQLDAQIAALEKA